MRSALNEKDGSLLVVDLLGGQAAERDDRLLRQNSAARKTYLWEQEAFEPVNREIHCHVSLASGKQVSLHLRYWAFRPGISVTLPVYTYGVP